MLWVSEVFGVVWNSFIKPGIWTLTAMIYAIRNPFQLSWVQNVFAQHAHWALALCIHRFHNRNCFAFALMSTREWQSVTCAIIWKVWKPRIRSLATLKLTFIGGSQRVVSQMWNEPNFMGSIQRQIHIIIFKNSNINIHNNRLWLRVWIENSTIPVKKGGKTMAYYLCLWAVAVWEWNH